MPLTTTEVAIIAPAIAVVGSLWVGRVQARRDDTRRERDADRERDRQRDRWEREDRQRWDSEMLDTYALCRTKTIDLMANLQTEYSNIDWYALAAGFRDATTIYARLKVISPAPIPKLAQAVLDATSEMSVYVRKQGDKLEDFNDTNPSVVELKTQAVNILLRLEDLESACRNQLHPPFRTD